MVCGKRIDLNTEKEDFTMEYVTLNNKLEYYHRTDGQLKQFAGWRPTFEKA